MSFLSTVSARVNPFADARTEPLSVRRDSAPKRLEAWVIKAPHRLRAVVRADELGLAALAIVVGVMAGLCVTVMSIGTQWAHRVLFALGPHQRLSGQVSLDMLRALVVPSFGGLAVGLLGLAIAKWLPRPTVDPIEANALYGGQMSVKDSLGVVAQTSLSNAVGASVGLEAGYTQIGAALASRLGRAFKVRRVDQRLLVGCGAAGAIAAAFNGPFTGAFYAFELVIGTYSLATLAPVMAAALAATLVGRLLDPNQYGFEVQVPTVIPTTHYLAFLVLGAICAGGGIAMMRGVTLTESLFRRSRMPPWGRPAIGGMAVGLLALISPQVMSAGHAALEIGLDAPYTMGHIALLITIKAMASAISIGSGFRGGLFFASLLLGALIGKLFAGLMALVAVTAAIPPVVCALVGMSAMAVAVVGGPLTMAFLALESTGSLPITIAVVVASVVSAVTVRRTFGYSFATWRFHLRGEAIRSAVDIGWVRNLTVGRMMRREVRTVRADTTLAAFRRDFPLGAEQRVIVTDVADRYAGVVLVAEAHSATSEKAERIVDLVHYAREALLPQMTVKEAIGRFEKAESDALAVIDGAETRKVLGMLTEQHALRRYNEELDRSRRELSGEGP